MPKRVAVILAGCGHRDGSDPLETAMVLIGVERGGGQTVAAAPDLPLLLVANHLTGETAVLKTPRALPPEAARLTRGQLVRLPDMSDRDLDALIIPGGWGVALHLSSYADKGEVCEVDPDVARLLKACLAAHKPIGLIGESAILAARVLGPVAGVRLTLGSKAFQASKHAAVMGADVRPAEVGDLVVDQKHRVVSTPGFLYADARLRDVAAGVEKLVRTVLSLARDGSPRPRPPEAPSAGLGSPRPSPPSAPPASPGRARSPGDPVVRRGRGTAAGGAS